VVEAEWPRPRLRVSRAERETNVANPDPAGSDVSGANHEVLRRLTELERQVETLARIVEELLPTFDAIPHRDDLERRVAALIEIVGDFVPIAAHIPRRVDDVERQVAPLLQVVGDLVPITGALNATLARLAAELGRADLYQARSREQDADILRLLRMIKTALPAHGGTREGTSRDAPDSSLHEPWPPP
jgi:hypothetical protein